MMAALLFRGATITHRLVSPLADRWRSATTGRRFTTTTAMVSKVGAVRETWLQRTATEADGATDTLNVSCGQQPNRLPKHVRATHLWDPTVRL
jgi:hypothetical protein